MDSNELLRTQRLFETVPTIRACHRILSSAILSTSGIVVERNGKPVALKESFQQHLDRFWLEFARDTIASLVVHGLVGVVIDVAPAPAFGMPKVKGEQNNKVRTTVRCCMRPCATLAL